MGKSRYDLSGKVIGRLTVVGLSDKRGSRGRRTVPLWECRCTCGTITYKATDTLVNSDVSMCQRCARLYASEKMRENAGYEAGTQISRIQGSGCSSANTSGVRGVYYDKRTKKWRARLRFRRRLMNFGSYERFEDAVRARQEAEAEYFGVFLSEVGGAGEKKGR